MKHISLTILLVVCAYGSLAAAPAAGDGAKAPTKPADLCPTVLVEDDFISGGAAVDALVQQVCSSSPETCTLDNANRQAFLGLNPELLAENSRITRKAVEAFFKEAPEPNQFEFYELGYIFDTILLKRVSDAVCGDANSALEKVQRLTSWTFEHISASSALQKRRTKSHPVYPLDIIERGHGLDFQISWAFAALVQQQGLATTLAYLPKLEATGVRPLLVLVFLEEGSVLVDPLRGLVWQDLANQKPIGISEALTKPKKIERLHPEYTPALAGSIKDASFRIPYHPLALLPKMKTVQSVLAKICGAQPVLYIDLARAHNAFGHLFCRAEGLESFSYNPALMTFTLPGRSYSCKVWLFPLVQLFAMGFQDVPQYREARRMHLTADFDKASLRYRRGLADAKDPEVGAEYTYLLGLLEYDRKKYKKSAQALQRYLDRYYISRADHVRFLLARIHMLEGNQEKSAQFIKELKNIPRYEHFLKR